MSDYNLKTGDLLLFNNEGGGSIGCFSKLIKRFTHSDITHVGMVLKDPTYINPALRGYFVWESGWEGEPDPQDNIIKFGVQITPLEEIIKSYQIDNGKIYVRRINYNGNMFCSENILRIHKVVYEKVYDIIPSDWINALVRRDTSPQKTDRFWCSALVGYIYTKCGCLHLDTDWSLLRPSDFKEDYLEYINGVSMDPMECLN